MNFPQLTSLLSPGPALLPVASPPDRRATPQPAGAGFARLPRLGEGRPFPIPHPFDRQQLTTSTRMSEEPRKVIMNADERVMGVERGLDLPPQGWAA
jgi:hypothetical protein